MEARAPELLAAHRRACAPPGDGTVHLHVTRNPDSTYEVQPPPQLSPGEDADALIARVFAVNENERP